MVTATKEDIEFEEAWATYTRLQSDRVLWQKIKARKRFLDEQALLMNDAREEGLEEGEAIGRTKGRTEEKIETARNMKQEGFDTAVIAKITGLSSSEIERLG